MVPAQCPHCGQTAVPDAPRPTFMRHSPFSLHHISIVACQNCGSLIRQAKAWLHVLVDGLLGVMTVWLVFIRANIATGSRLIPLGIIVAILTLAYFVHRWLWKTLPWSPVKKPDSSAQRGE